MGAISVNKAEFASFVRVYLKAISDSEASEFFNFLNMKKKDVSDVGSVNSGNNNIS